MCSINIKNLLTTSPANSSVLGHKSWCLIFDQVLMLTTEAFDSWAHSAPAEKVHEEEDQWVLIPVTQGFRVPFQLDSRGSYIDEMWFLWLNPIYMLFVLVKFKQYIRFNEDYSWEILLCACKVQLGNHRLRAVHPRLAFPRPAPPAQGGAHRLLCWDPAPQTQGQCPLHPRSMRTQTSPGPGLCSQGIAWGIWVQKLGPTACSWFTSLGSGRQHLNNLPQLDSACKSMKLEHSLTPDTKTNSNWLKDPNMRRDTIKHPKGNAGKALFDINCTSVFLGQSPSVAKIKVKINKRDRITYKLLHSRGNHKQNEKTTYRLGESICKRCDQQGVNVRNIQTAHTTKKHINNKKKPNHTKRQKT